MDKGTGNYQTIKVKSSVMSLKNDIKSLAPSVAKLREVDPQDLS